MYYTNMDTNIWKLVKREERIVDLIPDDLITMAEASRILEKTSRQNTRLMMFWYGVPFYKNPFGGYQGKYMVSRADVENMKSNVLAE